MMLGTGHTETIIMLGFDISLTFLQEDSAAPILSVPLDGTEYIDISSVADAFLLALQVDPVHNNVAFTSAQSGWSFTLQSFAQLYADVFGTAFDTTEFARRLWGDVYFHPDSESGYAAVHAQLVLFTMHWSSGQPWD